MTDRPPQTRSAAYEQFARTISSCPQHKDAPDCGDTILTMGVAAINPAIGGAAHFHPASLTAAQLPTLLEQRLIQSRKDVIAYIFMELLGTRRRKNRIRRIHAVGFDNDGTMVQAAADAALTRSGIFCVTHSTFKDGRTRDGDQVFPAEDRFRTIVPFGHPLEPPLLFERIEHDEIIGGLMGLRDRKGHTGYRIFSEELAALQGLKGCDEACLDDPARQHYAPGNPSVQARMEHGIALDRVPYLKVYPGPLFDPRPLAEKVIARLKAEGAESIVRPALQGVFLDVPVLSGFENSLEGVLLATLIDDQYSDLVASTNNLNPLKLRRCPFADEHHSGRGQSDNCLYCYDPAPDRGYRYPTMRCRHATCRDRRTSDFVAAMIALGDLDAADVYLDRHYREYY